MVPAVMVRSTPSTARKPRKSLVRPQVCSSGTKDVWGPRTGSTPSIQPSLTCEPQGSAGHTWWALRAAHRPRYGGNDGSSMCGQATSDCNDVAVVHTPLGQSRGSPPDEPSLSSPAQSDFSGPTS